MRVFILLLFLYHSLTASDPTWTVYPPSVMYSGQYRAFVALKSPGAVATVTQPIYRNDVPVSSYFTQPPKVVLSLMGLKQMAPTNGDTIVGFDVQVISNSTTNFYVNHNIYGVQMTYLIYMYLTLVQTNTDYAIGFYSQTFDMTASNKTYSFDIQNNVGQNYANYGTNTIEMKGFLAGYKMKQGTSNGMFLNFTLKPKNQSFFSIRLSVDSNSGVQKIWYYRMGYDRTAIQTKTYTDIFRDFNYELINNVNTKDIYSVGFVANQFMYRNYLTGANSINIAGTGPVSVQFVLYYYFAQNLSLDLTGNPPFKLNPAKGQYLMGDVFYHVVRNCTPASPNLNYFLTDRKCYATCPNNSVTNSPYFACLACHATCLTCASSSQTGCKSCNSTLKRTFNDPDSDGVGDCLCSQGFYEDSSTGTCKSCSSGCLACTNSGGVETCSSCNSTANFALSNGTCTCTSGFAKDASTSSCLACHFSCKTCSVSGAADKCDSCDTNFRTYDSGSKKCVCPSQHFDDGTNLACPSCHATCLTCASSSQTGCKSCNSTLKRTFNDPDSDGVGDCLCSQGFYEDSSTGTCKSCSSGCLACTNSGGVEICSSCDATLNLQLSNGQCVCKGSSSSSVGSVCSLNTCGDGILQRTQECDDNNVVNGDGCSDVCKVQAEHVCFLNTSLSNHSLCYYNGTILMTITDVKKEPFSNTVSLAIKIDTTANSEFLKDYLTGNSSIVLEDVKTRLLQAGSNVVEIYERPIYDENTKILSVKFRYNAQFDITKKKITFKPSNSVSSSQIKYFFNSPQAIVQLEKPYNKIDIIYFDQKEYSTAVSISYAFLALLILFWAVSLVFIGIGKANIAAEMMIVYQVVYASLLSQQSLQITLGGLSLYGKYTAGYNQNFFHNEVKCVNFTAINLECSLINNLNITFAIMLFILFVYVTLKLVNQILNYCEERSFVKNRQQRYMKNNNQQTSESMDQAPNFEFDASSESSQAIEQNYYKEKQFIPQKVYNLLLDLQFFFMFVTVIIWVLSMCYTNQNTVSSTVEGGLFGVLYLLMLIFWFLKYKTSTFSFVEAHKQTQTKYKEEESEVASENNFENIINLKMTEPKPKKPKKKRNKCSSVIFRVLFYPLLWLGLMGIGVILGITESVGYVTEAIVIAGSLLFAFIIWVSQIYKEKMNGIRAIINCLILVLVETFYIVSQKDLLTATGLPLAIIVIILMFLTLISNSASTFYLYKIELRLAKRKEELKSKSNIHNQLHQLQGVKHKNDQLYGNLYFKKQDKQSSLGELNVLEQAGRRGNTPQNMNAFMRPQNQNIPNPMVPAVSRNEISLILNNSRLQKSNSFIRKSAQELNLEKIQNLRYSGPFEQNQSEIKQPSQKKKLFGYDPSKDFYSPTKSVATTKHTAAPFSDTHMKMDFTPNKY